MCVIIHKPKSIVFPEDDVQVAYDNNEDGFGYMYYDEELDKIVARKTTDIDGEGIQRVFKQLEGREVVYHYRYKTKGKVVKAQCHPFKVLDKKKHGVDMYFMHNGTIHNAKIEGDESDTQAFNRTILKPILSKSPSLVRTKAFAEIVQNYISNNSKLVFMYGKGKIVKINEEAGSTRNECWVSNTYSFSPTHRSKNTTVGGQWNRGKTTTKVGTNSQASSRSNASSAYGINRTTTVDKHTSIGKASGVLLGGKIVEGDEVYMYHDDDKHYNEVGTITEIQRLCCIVEFKDLQGDLTTMSFYLDDAKPFSQYNEKYTCIPMYAYEKEEEHSLTVDSQKKDKIDNTEQESTSTEETESKDESNVVEIAEERDAKKQVEEVEEVEYDNYKVNAAKRHGGVNITDSLHSYGDFDFVDVYDLDPQERFEFFVNNPEVSFNMFQDLVENIVQQDDIYYQGYYQDDEEIEFKQFQQYEGRYH